MKSEEWAAQESNLWLLPCQSRQWHCRKAWKPALQIFYDSCCHLQGLASGCSRWRKIAEIPRHGWMEVGSCGRIPQARNHFWRSHWFCCPNPIWQLIEVALQGGNICRLDPALFRLVSVWNAFRAGV